MIGGALSWGLEQIDLFGAVEAVFDLFVAFVGELFFGAQGESFDYGTDDEAEAGYDVGIADMREANHLDMVIP